MTLEWYRPVLREYDKHAARVAEQMAQLPWPESRTTPDEGAYSVLCNAWEEFALQVQEEASFYWDAYEDQIRLFARRLVEELDWQDTAILWAATNAAIDHDSDEPALYRSDMQEAIVEKLWESVCDSAGNYNLRHYFDWYEEDEEDTDDDEEQGEDNADTAEAAIEKNETPSTAVTTVVADAPNAAWRGQPSLFD